MRATEYPAEYPAEYPGGTHRCRLPNVASDSSVCVQRSKHWLQCASCKPTVPPLSTPVSTPEYPRVPLCVQPSKHTLQRACCGAGGRTNPCEYPREYSREYPCVPL